LEKLERVRVTRKPVKILSRNQVRVFIRMQETIAERVPMELLVAALIKYSPVSQTEESPV
jgi:hypothetical protein